MSKINQIIRATHRIFGSKKFFYVTVALLFVQATWFALTVRYPMAFDENYHFGIIQIYSHQWLPFISHHPAGTEEFGNLSRYDSYMFHYLMSFVYRFISIFTSNETLQIIILRFINIACFIGGMFLFRNLFRSLRISERIINFSSLMLVLIPAAPFLAATINYDNFVFLIVPIFAGLAIRCSQAIAKGKLPITPLILMIATGILGSLTKYAFTPIFLAGMLYPVFVWLRSDTKQKILTDIRHSFMKKKLYVQVLLLLIAVLSIGLFAERYGVNYAVYHRYEPTCEMVRTIDECVQYGPWGRDYQIKAIVDATNPALDPPIEYFVPVWVGNYLYRLYFAVNFEYASADPLPLPYYTSWVIGIFGLLLCLYFWRSLVRSHRYLLFFALVIVFYVAALFAVNFTSYLQLHTIVAANGRYLLLIMPFLFVWFALAYQQFFTRFYKSRAHKTAAALAVVVVILSLSGGGAATYLLRSEPSWYWQNSSAPEINTTVKNVLRPIVPGA